MNWVLRLKSALYRAFVEYTAIKSTICIAWFRQTIVTVKSDLVWIGLEAWFDYSSVRNMTSTYHFFLRNFFSVTYPNCWVFVKRKSPNWVIASPFTLYYLGLLHWSNREVGSVVTNSDLHPAKWKYISVPVVVRVGTRVPTFLFYSLPKSLSIQIEN